MMTELADVAAGPVGWALLACMWSIEHYGDRIWAWWPDCLAGRKRRREAKIARDLFFAEERRRRIEHLRAYARGEGEARAQGMEALTQQQLPGESL